MKNLNNNNSGYIARLVVMYIFIFINFLLLFILRIVLKEVFINQNIDRIILLYIEKTFDLLVLRYNIDLISFLLCLLYLVLYSFKKEDYYFYNFLKQILTIIASFNVSLLFIVNYSLVSLDDNIVYYILECIKISTKYYVITFTILSILNAVFFNFYKKLHNNKNYIILDFWIYIAIIIISFIFIVISLYNKIIIN